MGTLLSGTGTGQAMVARVSSTDGDFHLLPLTHHLTPAATDRHHLMIILWLLSGLENVYLFIFLYFFLLLPEYIE